MAIFRTRRQRRYDALRKRHLTPKEAFEFSKMTVMAVGPGGKIAPNPVIAKIVQERSFLWGAFRVEAVAKNWSSTRAKREWSDRIAKLYESPELKKRAGEWRVSNWIVRKDSRGRPIRPTISPWDYYDAVQLIEDLLDWDTPRRHRKRVQDTVSVDKITIQRWIHDLNRRILQTVDPAQKARFVGQRQRLKLTMRRTA